MNPERRPNPDRPAEPLGARLRALPRPAVPDGLEARLLAAIPADRPAPRRRAVRAGAAVALVAAGVLAVLGWPRHDGADPVPVPEQSESVPRVTPLPSDDSDGVPASWPARRLLGDTDPPSFNWPVENMLTSSIPPDLLD